MAPMRIGRTGFGPRLLSASVFTRPGLRGEEADRPELNERTRPIKLDRPAAAGR